ncbi:acyl-CoA Delta-9 desaturase [Megalopta genalis]|uniref:acyl-CoA Delta-9 desaturase n=1 Tax=Megalopta genalis TaxID=115081 RepID=UPI001442F251|nr:(11Z)-hexadec-11-enoyl-CoA conjugase-like [Megalopta genalis]XP_033329807.1 (11Z)-hexadec-11-enoyl-CoA conjugase-like [Megalopta genalis]
MAPNLFGTSATLYLEASQQGIHKEKSASENVDKQQLIAQNSSQQPKYKWDIVWRNVIAFTYLHCGSLYAMYLLIFHEVSPYTFIWGLSLGMISAVGVTGGAHRLWAHRAYKAKWPLRVILMILQTIAFQNHIYEWARDHRVHHKFTDTDADPHNAQRGFFFSHIGWLMLRKHPDVIKKGATIDMSDLEQDPVVVWQRRLYIILMPLFSFIIPTWIPIYFWKEAPLTAWYATVWRYTFTLNGTWLVNSAAHIWGMKPYDKTIGPTENRAVALIAIGEGWHNYHHVFPWDYKASELGDYTLNATTAVIDLFSKIGWAYDMKTVPAEIVKKRAMRTGDGSIYENGQLTHTHSHEDAIWGWGDKDMEPDEIKTAEVYNKSD